MGRVSVVHPDLGVGGAERLIVDASKALQESGHQVTIYTGYHDKNRCFQETKDGTIKTCVIAGFLPRSIFNRFHALLAYLRIILIAIYLILFEKHDIILCDQVSSCIPIFKYFDFRNRRSRIVFYCHFPDQLLTRRESLTKSIYRKPLDMFEEYSTGLADSILINSKFTGSVVKNTFRSLKNREFIVLYPCVDVKSFEKFEIPTKQFCYPVEACRNKSKEGNFIFLSLNRFETKKNVALAIRALNSLLSDLEIEKLKKKIHLIVAGGYDHRLSDCVNCFGELEDLVRKFKLDSHVTFIKSPSDQEKLLLLKLSNVVVYTPENEHFGIVPLEAMAMSKPIIASASGGPLESIVHNVSGFLCDPDRYHFAAAMHKLYTDSSICEKMGAAGYERVVKHFSYEAFKSELNKICFPR